jgi:CPA2 family monovalent cation:H+ antiporter-2
MTHDAVLIATIAAGIATAFILGVVAVRIGLPPLVGYLLAGIIVGPFTPGYVADAGLASQLAELGVILLMFGVGLHFSIGDLVAVRRTVIPGALAQTTITTLVVSMAARVSGMTAGNAVVLGLSVGVASTAVLLKAFEARDRLDTPDGKLAVGWLVVEDVSMVLALVLLPAFAPALGSSGDVPIDAAALTRSVALAIAKVAAFIALMFLVGRRFVPWLLERVVRLGSRELFTLAVLVMALGIGTIAAELFGVSFALGAFFAGAVISESELSRRAASEALPMQDAFAVLFFVSVGMLFDPSILVRQPLQVAGLIAVVVLWKSGLAYTLLRLLGTPAPTAAVVGTSVGQIGEFSFIVAGLGVSLGIAGVETQTLIVAAAIGAIVLNGPVVNLAIRRSALMGRREAAESTSTVFEFGDLRDHVVLVGFGRVGGTVADALDLAGVPMVVVEEDERAVDRLRASQERAIRGDATRPDVLARAGIDRARLLVITAPDPLRARRIVEIARERNPHVAIAVRTHNPREQAFFERSFSEAAPGRAVYAEREAAFGLARYSLLVVGESDDAADRIEAALRAAAPPPGTVDPSDPWKTSPTH